ncbi:MAG: hypothetical protein ACKKMS_00065 [Candidatus Nealsonbacteria bacterium]
MEGEKIKIELTESEVEYFKKFRKYQDDFDILLKAGIFDFTNGCAIIHRDSTGTLKNVEIKIMSFVKSKKVKVIK